MESKSYKIIKEHISSFCDVLFKEMVNNGLELLMEPTDMFWGDRFSRVPDPFGHEWGLSAQLKKVSP